MAAQPKVRPTRRSPKKDAEFENLLSRAEKFEKEARKVSPKSENPLSSIAKLYSPAKGIGVMTTEFEIVAQKLAELSEQLTAELKKSYRDPAKRIELLVAMRMCLDEAERLARRPANSR